MHLHGIGTNWGGQTRIILGMGSASEKQCYNITSLIIWYLPILKILIFRIILLTLEQ